MIILGLDPGITTGTTIFDIPKEVKTIPLSGDLSKWIKIVDELKDWREIAALVEEYRPDIIVIEEFRLYAEKAKSKTHSNFPEVQMIGQIEMIAETYNIPTHKQNAQIAKSFYTDDKLKKLNLYQKGMKHARDAIRHVLYFFDFNKKKVFICKNCEHDGPTKNNVCTLVGCDFKYRRPNGEK